MDDEGFRLVSQLMRACSETLTDLSLGLQLPYLARFKVELGPTIPLLRRFCYCTNAMDSVLNMANMISALCPAPLEQLMLRIPIECMRQKGWAELQTSINAVKAAEIIMVVDDHPNYEVALRKTLSHCNLSSTLFVVSHTSSGIAFGYSEETFARFQKFIRRDHGRSGRPSEPQQRRHHPLPALNTQASQAEIEAHAGVATVKATHQVYGKYSKWFLFLGLGLAAYIYSLDSQTTWAYLAWAASELQDHSLISTIQVAQSIIIACGKPAIAKLADVQSRGVAYIVVLVFYVVVSYIVIASAHNIQTVAGGIILYAVGYTGLQLIRPYFPSILINAFIGSNVSTAVLSGAGWRWGYGMFAILIPASLAPLIITLTWAERKATRLGLIPHKSAQPAQNIFTKIRNLVAKLDLFGLILIGTSVALILLPLTLAKSASNGWHNPSMIAMLVVGCVLLLFIAPWEAKVAKYPVLPGRFLKNKSIVGASLIGFFDFISFYLTYTYLYSFVVVVKPWQVTYKHYLLRLDSVSGSNGIRNLRRLRNAYFHRYKYMLVAGLTIRLFGVGLMIHSRGANASDAEIVWTQIIQSMGGGIAAVTSQVAAQASVPHVDVATATAVVLLLTEIGGAIGNAISGAIWTNMMPGKLLHYLPFLSETERAAIYSSISVITTQYPRGDPVREGVISAYGDVMKIMLIVATAVSVVPLGISLFMPNWYLGDTQNAVDNEDLAGHATATSDDERHV
ncbi:hypothetical protein CPB85DRAFT_1429077 [Mucidula mucida]|nr:hypothetical protein CPB85DRAFT_1429077 [Mucidula mucida]